MVLADAAPIVGSLIGIERFLRGSQRFRDVLQVQADSRPGVKPAAHRIDEHVGRRQVRCGFGVTCLPPLESREGIVFFLRAPDFDQRVLPPSLKLRRTAVALAEAGWRPPA
jgi:hypothetical protein